MLAAALAQCPPCGGDGAGLQLWVVFALAAGGLLLVRRVISLGRQKEVSVMNKAGKIAVVVALAVVVIAVVVAKKRTASPPGGSETSPAATAADTPAVSPQAAGLPRLIELGSVTCIPCKMMAPILDELRRDYAGKLQVDFIDVQQNRDALETYQIRLIPTQVLLDGSGKELFRHEGFFPKDDLLAKWKELGYDFAAASPEPAFERLELTQADTRPRETVCYMCDRDVDPKTLVVVKTDKGEVRLCSPHCYFIMYSCLTEDRAGFEKKVSVTDYATGKSIAATEAVYLYGLDEATGRPVVKAFADRDAATKERQASGGSVLAWHTLQDKELSHRCGFCDRAVYPEDAALVRVGGLYTWGCCSHCAMGVTARTGKDIEVHERDRLTGEEIVVTTLNGSIASLEPKTAVAWFGLRKGPDGKFTSAGCFHQGFFRTADNLRKWLEQHPLETGKLISIQQALADKMKLSPQQIQKACKIGECAPK